MYYNLHKTALLKRFLLMFKILGVLFFIIIAILLVGLGVIASVIMRLFGRGGGRTTFHTTTRTYRPGNGYSPSDSNRTSSTSSDGTVETEEGSIHPPKVKKLFGKDEGEYVDYEEVKD